METGKPVEPGINSSLSALVFIHARTGCLIVAHCRLSMYMTKFPPVCLSVCDASEPGFWTCCFISLLLLLPFCSCQLGGNGLSTSASVAATAPALLLLRCAALRCVGGRLLRHTCRTGTSLAMQSGSSPANGVSLFIWRSVC